MLNVLKTFNISGNSRSIPLRLGLLKFLANPTTQSADQCPGHQQADRRLKQRLPQPMPQIKPQIHLKTPAQQAGYKPEKAGQNKKKVDRQNQINGVEKFVFHQPLQSIHL
jgi:hypothetical protein